MPLWTQTLTKFGEKKADISQVINSIKSDRCVHEIRAAQSNGAVFVLCSDDLKPNENCSECQHPVVVKLSKGAVYKSRGGGVTKSEAKVFREIRDAQSKLLGPFKVYKAHILQYVKHYEQDDEIVLLSKFVKPSGPRNLAEFIKSGRCTLRDIEIIIIEVFMTLFVIREIVPGFLHLDLLASQIFLTPTDMVDTLPINKTSNFVFGPRSYSTVIGDFGTSITNRNIDAIGAYGFNNDLVDILQDAFRFFNDIIDLAEGQKIQKPLQLIARNVFKGRYGSLVQISKQDDHNYLSKAASSENTFIGIRSYAEVVNRLPFYKKYIQYL